MSRKGAVDLEITCGLDAEDCKPWHELTPEQQERQRGTDPGCDSTGMFGGRCIGCYFCLDWDTIDAYQIEEEHD